MNSDFRELLTALNDCRVNFLVVGGYAYIHYAEPRYTKDIDLWIQSTPENAVRLREALVRFGSWVEGMTLDHFTTERTMFQIGLPPCRVDFLTSIPGLEFTAAFAARKIAEIDGLAIPFISLPDLITAKRTAGREQDLRDIAGLERVLREES
jgi:predicted nucleotidyltransferase